MNQYVFLTVFLFVSIICFGQTPKKAEVAELEDCNIYYEVYGEGEPLFLLHGFFFSSDSWKPLVEDFANDYEVYLVDLTGHGNSSNFKGDFSISETATDLYALIQYLGLKQLKAIGFSYGGDAVFHLSSMNPNLVESMITIGCLGTWDVKNYPGWIKYFSYENIERVKWIREHQSNESRVKWLMDQFPNYTVSLSDEAYQNIEANTLIIVGDNDVAIPWSYIGRVKKLMPSCNLWIVPNTGHNAHEGRNKNDFVRISKLFLSGGL
jgi:pimeloyl-ACP methyl ester carboxylesterase